MREQTFSHWPSWPLPVRQTATVTPRNPCSYLPGKFSTFRMFQAEHVTGQAYQHLLDAGFRRSGQIIYQPACSQCRQCVPLRVPVGRFAPTKSQRRVLRHNAELVVRIAPPEPTLEKWELYERYQREWHGAAAAHANSPDDFVRFLYQSPVESLEFDYRDKWGNSFGHRHLRSLSAEPQQRLFLFRSRHASRSLGTFSSLYEIMWAGRQDLVHWYAGYWIQQCPSMAYKSRFGPAELLGTDGVWREVTSPESRPHDPDENLA